MNELKIITMQYQTDCEVAAIATALQISYDEAKKLLDWRRLPKGLENPILGNPWNLYRALVDAGYWKSNKTLTQLLKGDYIPYKTIVLLHDPKSPIMKQHWVVLGNRLSNKQYEIYFGNDELPEIVSDTTLKGYFLAGWPNCAFSIYKANITRIWWEKIKVWFCDKLY
jgi:hypothetical protein